MADAEEALSDIRDDLPDSFEGWIWIQLAKNDHHLPTLYGWAEKGCPALGGKALTIKRFRAWSDLRGRDYVRVDDLKKIKDFAPNDGPVGIPFGFTPRSETLRRFNRTFLSKFADRGMNQPHPALGKGGDDPGKSIESAVYHVIIKGQRLRAVAYKTSELKKIDEFTVPAQWSNREQIQAKYVGLIGDSKNRINSELQFAEEFGTRYSGENGRIKTCLFPTPPTHGKPRAIKYWLVSDLDRLVRYIAERKALARPAIGEQARHQREYIHPKTKQRYLPRREAMILADVSTARERIDFDLWTKSCPHLGGRPLRTAQSADRLFRSKHHGHTVYLYTDLNAIYKAKHNTVNARLRIPTGAKTGRPSKYPMQIAIPLREEFRKYKTDNPDGGLKEFAVMKNQSPKYLRAMFNAVDAIKPK